MPSGKSGTDSDCSYISCCSAKLVYHLIVKTTIIHEKFFLFNFKFKCYVISGRVMEEYSWCPQLTAIAQ